MFYDEIKIGRFKEFFLDLDFYSGETILYLYK
jgi:hypothetical protein